MRYKIFWLNRAKLKLQKIYDFTEISWNKKTSDDFIVKLRYKLQILSYFPNIGQKSKLKPDVRRFIIMEHISLFYKIDGKKIVILALFDNRQNPDKLKY